VHRSSGDLLEGGTTATASLAAEPLHLTCLKTIATFTLAPAITNALLEFLRAADRGTPPSHPFDGRGVLFVGAAIVLGGVLLNLTPCVLPMIPINLAIIGAGRVATSRRRGWLLGAAHGSGMALVYGVLGGIIVAPAGTLGVLNSSAWFNAAIAVLFIPLGLAMFDVVTVDFSRWSGNISVDEKSRGRIGLAFYHDKQDTPRMNG
jgi:thioredoxin:protein disulfide reductase